jgi:hypothetical protein
MPGSRWALNVLDVLAWGVFLGLGLLLWASGVVLFLRSKQSPAKKAVWAAFLVAVGAAIGYLLPLVVIRNRFLLLLAVLPIVALVDVRLSRSNRSFWFWFRACAFEVCTVFGSAAITRAVLRSM